MRTVVKKNIVKSILALIFALVAGICVCPSNANAAAKTTYVRTSMKSYQKDQASDKYLLLASYSYKYDKKGNQTQCILKSGTFSYDPSIPKTSVTYKTYKTTYKNTYKKGKLSKVQTNSSGNKTTDSYTYNKKGLLTKLVTKSGTQTTKTTTYTYNKKGQLKTENTKYNDGTSYTAAYKNGSIIKSVETFKINNEQVSITQTYTYNKKNQLTKTMLKYGGAWSSRSNVYTTFSDYDKAGNYLKNTVTVDGEVVQKNEFTYKKIKVK